MQHRRLPRPVLISIERGRMKHDLNAKRPTEFTIGNLSFCRLVDDIPQHIVSELQVRRAHDGNLKQELADPC